MWTTALGNCFSSIIPMFLSFAQTKGTVPCHITLWKDPAMMTTLFSDAGTGITRLVFSASSTWSTLVLLLQCQLSFP